MHPDEPDTTLQGDAVDNSAGSTDSTGYTDSTWHGNSIPFSGLVGPADIPASSLVGRTIDGRYEIHERIGEGGFSLVFRARQLSTNCDVAIKFPRNAGEAAARVRKGQRHLGRLGHHYIAGLIDAGEIDSDGGKLPYVVMELVPGAGRLTDHCRAHSLDRIARLELFAKVCDAVAEAHRRGVVHRDLKPGNILVNAAGEPRVIDFDIAITVTRSHAASVTESISTDGRIAGTLLYMSPEQWHGETVGPPSDVYSLGILLRELLTDRTPSLAEASARLERQPVPERETTAAESLPRRLRRLLDRCLRSDPSERWQHAGALAAEVHDCIDHLASRSALGRVLEGCEAAWSGPRNRRIAVAAATMAIVAGAIFLVTGPPNPYDDAVRRAAAAFAQDGDAAARQALVDVAQRRWREQFPGKAMPPELVCMKSLLPDATEVPLATGLITRFDTDGRWLATATAEGGVILSDTIPPYAPRYRLSGFKGSVTDLAWGPEGLLVGGDTAGTILLWKVDETALEHDSSPRLRVVMTSGGPVAVDVAPDGDRVAAASATGEVCCWPTDRRDEGIQALFRNPSASDVSRVSAAPSIRFSADGSWLFVSMPDGTLRVLDGRSGREHAVVRPAGRNSPTLCGSPDRSQLVSIAPDGPLLRHDAKTGRILPGPEHAPAGCLLATFMAGGERLVAVYDDPGNTGRGSRLVIFDMSADRVITRPVVLTTDRRITDIAGMGDRLAVEIDGGRRLWSPEKPR